MKYWAWKPRWLCLLGLLGPQPLWRLDLIPTPMQSQRSLLRRRSTPILYRRTVTRRVKSRLSTIPSRRIWGTQVLLTPCLPHWRILMGTRVWSSSVELWPVVRMARPTAPLSGPGMSGSMGDAVQRLFSQASRRLSRRRIKRTKSTVLKAWCHTPSSKLSWLSSRPDEVWATYINSLKRGFEHFKLGFC